MSLATTRPRILVIDDEQPIMEALCDMLGQHGYAPSGHTSARAGLAALDREKFALLLTDLMMPEMDGIALLKEAQRIDPDLVGVVITGKGSITAAVAAMQAGAIDFVQKPFKLNTMLPVLSRALSMRRLRVENRLLEQQLKDRALELEMTNKELESFSFSVSHDLRAPLRRISSFALIVSQNFRDSLPEEAKRLLRIVVTNSREMEQLIEDLLRLSQFGRQPLSKQTTNLSAIATEVLEEIPAESKRHAAITLGAFPACSADPSLIRQVFVNLLINAFKFTRHTVDARIEVGTIFENSETVYFVRDNGAGFDMRYAAQLFAPFQRFHPAADYEGTGIGLSIVQRIVHRHGGRIWANSKPNEGATFYFTLPD